MVDSLIGGATALRWALPVHTPSDQKVDDQRETAAIDAADSIVRDNPLEHQRRTGFDLPNAAQGDGTPAHSLAFGEVEGRAAVAAARRPATP